MPVSRTRGDGHKRENRRLVTPTIRVVLAASLRASEPRFTTRGAYRIAAARGRQGTKAPIGLGPLARLQYLAVGSRARWVVTVPQLSRIAQRFPNIGARTLPGEACSRSLSW